MQIVLALIILGDCNDGQYRYTIAKENCYLILLEEQITSSYLSWRVYLIEAVIGFEMRQPGKNFQRDRALNDVQCARHSARNHACPRDPLRAIARDFSDLWPISTHFHAA